MLTDRRNMRGRLLATASLLSIFLAGPVSAAVLTGQVSDSSGTRTLASAEVEIVELGRKVSAGPDGRFRFSDLQPGTYTLRTTYVGAAPEQTSVVVGEGETRKDIVLSPSGGATEVASVLVVGQLANLSNSLTRQRGAEGVESVLTRDSIGQFPDQNVAESVRRLPGVNVLNDQGEGRFIAVRGLDPDLNAASINGARVPSPEADVRSVALDVVASELIESIEIKKTLTPDMDADTIGASIEINTTSALDRKKPFTAVGLEGSYNDLNGEWSPKATFDFSRTFGDRLGVAGGLSYAKRKFSTDNIEMDGWKETDDGVVYADTLEYRDYDVERKRFGGSLSLDYRLTDDTNLYARLLHSVFEDQEDRGRLTFEMDEEPASAIGKQVTFLSDDGEIKVTRDFKDRFEAQSITSLVVGGKTYAGPWRFDYSASYAKSREKEAGSIDPIAFERKFEDAGEFGVTFDYGKMTHPRFAIGAGNSAFLDPSEYEFDKIERTSLSLSEDEEKTFRFDARREFGLAGGNLQIQFGAKARQREKTYDLEIDVLDGFDGDFTLEDVLGKPSYGLADIGPLPGRGPVRKFFNANRADFELNPVDTAFESAVADYAVNEDIYAGYAMARYSAGPLQAIGGLRVEQTRQKVSGNLVELVEEGGERDGVVLDEDTVFVTPVGYKREYTDWLPSAVVRYEATPDTVLRAGVFRSVVRPKPGQIAPRFMVEEADDGEREGEFGNPDLKPYKAWNFDLSAEWYFADRAVLSAGVFYKSVEDFIVEVEFENGEFNGIAYDMALIPMNGDKATIKGFEFNYQQSLSFLPGPFDGLLAGFNYTYTDAKGDILGRSIPLPASAKNTFNAMLGYEKGPISIRASASYRDKYLDELGDEAETDRYVQDHIQYDLSAKYRVRQGLQIVAEFVNLGDEPYVAYQNGPKGKRLLQYEEYSWTGKIGVRATF